MYHTINELTKNKGMPNDEMHANFATSTPALTAATSTTEEDCYPSNDLDSFSLFDFIESTEINEADHSELFNSDILQSPGAQQEQQEKKELPIVLTKETKASVEVEVRPPTLVTLLSRSSSSSSFLSLVDETPRAASATISNIELSAPSPKREREFSFDDSETEVDDDDFEEFLRSSKKSKVDHIHSSYNTSGTSRNPSGTRRCTQLAGVCRLHKDLKYDKTSAFKCNECKLTKINCTILGCPCAGEGFLWESTHTHDRKAYCHQFPSDGKVQVVCITKSSCLKLLEKRYTQLYGARFNAFKQPKSL